MSLWTFFFFLLNLNLKRHEVFIFHIFCDSIMNSFRLGHGEVENFKIKILSLPETSEDGKVGWENWSSDLSFAHLWSQKISVIIWSFDQSLNFFETQALAPLNLIIFGIPYKSCVDPVSKNIFPLIRSSDPVDPQKIQESFQSALLITIQSQS